MNINIHNYEEFALDYLEDNLSEPALASFNRFLEKHPEIRLEMEGLETVRIEKEDLEYFPLFSRKQELYREAALVSLLKRPVYIKIWQVAAVFILLLSSVWVINSYYTGERLTGNTIAVAEAESIAPEEVSSIEKDETMIMEKPQVASTNTAVVAEEEVRTTSLVASIPAKENPAVFTTENRAHRESEIEMASQTELDFIYESTEEELLESLYSDEFSPNLRRQNTPDIAFLPVNQMMLEMPSEPLDVATQKLLWNPVYVEAIEDELHLIRFFAKVADRIIPDQVAANLNRIDLNINTERIPQEFLPRFIQQSN